MSRPPLIMICAATAAGLAAGPVSGQTEMAIELGASLVGPPAGLDGDNARFGMAGLRFSHYTLGGSGTTASLLFGRAFGDPNGGDFVSGVVGGTLRDEWGSGWTGGLDLRLMGFEVRDPFPYRALALEGGPSVSLQSGALTVTAAAVGGVGRSRVEVWRRINGLHLVFEDQLWRAGGTGELLLGRGTFRAGIVGGVHETPGGTYTSGGARMILAGGWGAMEARVDVWEAPVGSATLTNASLGGREVTGGLTFMIPLKGWSLRGFMGKSEPDPLTLAEPGSGGGGLLLSVSIFSSGPSERGDDNPYQILSQEEGRAHVRVAVEAPADARAVQLLGDFTLWAPVPMRREGSLWVTEIDLPAGTYHYGFLVDDEWYVPDDARDVVPDEWGRLSAILVTEGAS